MEKRFRSKQVETFSGLKTCLLGQKLTLLRRATEAGRHAITPPTGRPPLSRFDIGINATGEKPGPAIGQRTKPCAQLDYSLMAVLKFSRSSK